MLLSVVTKHKIFNSLLCGLHPKRPVSTRNKTMRQNQYKDMSGIWGGLFIPGNSGKSTTYKYNAPFF